MSRGTDRVWNFSASAASRSLTPSSFTMNHLAAGPNGLHLEAPPVGQRHRTVIADRQRIGGRGFDAHLAFHAVRRADHAETTRGLVSIVPSSFSHCGRRWPSRQRRSDEGPCAASSWRPQRIEREDGFAIPLIRCLRQPPSPARGEGGVRPQPCAAAAAAASAASRAFFSLAVWRSTAFVPGFAFSGLLRPGASSAGLVEEAEHAVRRLRALGEPGLRRLVSRMTRSAASFAFIGSNVPIFAMKRPSRGAVASATTMR